MDSSIDIQIASEDTDLPTEAQMRTWANACLNHYPDAEMTIRVVDEAEITELNHRYRHKDSATNVLSFPADLPEELDLPLLGDIIICAQVVNQEAREQGKSRDAHWAHMVIHGTLHLMGYDHIEDADADDMESLETELLGRLGFPPPYEHET